MDGKELDIRFQEAVEIASKMSQSDLPQDVQLRLYAYYKQATMGGTQSQHYSPALDLRNAFKTNAWMQISHLSVEDAKELYIEAIHEIANERK
ncbi:MAG: acyl-CoA-binding protein [Flavobacterium sp.]